MFSAVKEETHFDLKAGGLFFSNSTEVLFELLKIHLFQEDANPFAERILIVPSMSLQQWIQRMLASSLSISCGFTSTFLNKGIELITEKLTEEKRKFFIPNHLELFLRIDEEIEHISKTQEPLFKPMLHYIEGRESRKKELVRYLTHIFERYGIYGARAAPLWEQKPENWQQALWARVFENCDYPARLLPNLKLKKKESFSVHLFAFSHISPLHFQFLTRVASEVPLYFYQLSPSQEFWSDLPLDHPSLVGSLGKVGKAMAKQIEESRWEPQEAFLAFGGHSLLKKIQRDFLHLEAHEPLAQEEDGSIQILRTSTPHQEVIHLHQWLVKLFEQGGLEPKDVIVMAPHIADYAPFIQSIFGKALPYQITDMPLNHYAPLVKGLFQLLDLEETRWSVAAIFELLTHPLFSSPFSFTQEEIKILRTFAETTGICWGFNETHRNALLKKRHCALHAAPSQTTWMEGLGFLLEELALSVEPKRIQFSQAETLGNFMSLLQSLYDELQQLDHPKTLQEWALLFRKLTSTYFKVCDDSEILEIAFNHLAKASDRFPTKNYSFSIAYMLLKESIGQECVTINRKLCQAIHFCSLLPMRAIPSKVICLLGMNHDAFPRKEELQALDLLKESPYVDYCPTRVDFDRYLFLEALLSAREKLLICYIGQDPYDLSELPPSSVVAQILPLVSPKQIMSRFSYAPIPISPKPFVIKTLSQPTLPIGEFVIDLNAWMRFARSPLRHYLSHQNLKVFEEKKPAVDEPMLLAAHQKAMICKNAQKEGLKTAFEGAVRQGQLPSGMLGSLARELVEREYAGFESLFLKKVELPPLELSLSSSLSCVIKGFIEPVDTRGLVLAEKPTFKNCARIWPLFLCVQQALPHLRAVSFAGSNEIKESCFEEVRPLLLEWASFYFYAKAIPFFWTLDWIEPILNQDRDALSKAPVYDSLMKWQLMGKDPIHYDSIIEAYHPLIHKLYGDMARGWF